ncbi:DUF87 domain-containing protein [archaeon]|nr:DUF87 domain-containing protein [archaeon]
MKTKEKNETARILMIFAVVISALFSLIPLAKAEYEIFPDEIHEKVKTYEIIEEVISIKNRNAVPITGAVTLEGNITEFLTLDNKSTVVQPGSESEIGLRFFGKGATEGRYEGAVVINGDIKERIPVIFDTKGGEAASGASIIVDVNLLQPIVVRGGTLKFKADALNLLSDTEQALQIEYNIYKLEGNELSNNSIYSYSENVSVQQSYSSVKSVNIPPDAEVGDYILRVVTNYLNQTSTTDTLFTVREHFYEQDLFGVVPVWFMSLFVTLFSSGYMSYRVYKKRQDSKKRFHAKLEYDLIPQDGPRSLFVGNIAETNKRAYIDMDVLTVHSIVAGSTGGGKSISAQDIIEEALIKGTAVAVFDPTAQWSGMLRKLEDKKFLEFYPQFGMDPKKDARGFNGNIKAVKNGREIIDIFKYLKPGEIQIFTTNTLDPKDYDIFVASMIQQIFHSKLDEFRGLKYMIVFDEIHRILPKFGGSGAGFTQIERGCREFRKWGIGIVLISQVLGDFVGEIKANINTQVQMKTRDEGDLNRIKMQYGEEYIQSLVKSPVGSGMLQNSNWNRGRPYYVTFRPILHSVVRLTDEELDKYNKYNAIVDQLEFEFDQLEGLKQDVFDLRLELKLAKDKIKTGNFNMVQIYLDGLTPRVQKMWDKLGKKPEALQVKLLDSTEIDSAVKKAKEERAKLKKEEQVPLSQQQAPQEEKKLTPEEIKQKEDQINELTGQINTALERSDKNMANELFAELPPSIVKFPDDKKKEWQKKLDELKQKMA